MHNPLDVKVNDDHTLDVALSLSLFFGSVSLGFPYTAHEFFSLRLSNHFKGFGRTFSKL
jgi:hypothetical protein